MRSAVPTTVTVRARPPLPRAGRVRGLLRRLGGAGQRRQVRQRHGRDGAADPPEGFAVVEISDDGDRRGRPRDGTGLRGLADRVEALGGRFAVSDAAGGGTVVRAEMPLAREDAAGPA